MLRRNFLKALCALPVVGLVRPEKKDSSGSCASARYDGSSDERYFQTVMYVEGQRHAVWDRQLSDSEINSLYQHPYQMFLTPEVGTWQGINFTTTGKERKENE